MQRRGEYGGGYDNTPVQQEAPKNISENRQEAGGANLEEFSSEEWDKAQQLHETRGTVFSTLDAGMKGETSVVDGPNSDPKFWKIMGESLKSLGVPEDYIQRHMGKMEGLMAEAQESGPAVLADQRTYIDTAVAALNESIKYARTRDMSLKAGGNPTSTAWDSMQLRRRVEQDKFAAEKLRRGSRSQGESVATPALAEELPVTENDNLAGSEPNDTVRDLDAYREKKAQQGFTFPDVALHKRNPKYWKSMATTIAENPQLRGVAKSIETLMKRVERGDPDSVLDPEIQRITEDIDRRTAA